jgi:hypothetical protein
MFMISKETAYGLNFAGNRRWLARLGHTAGQIFPPAAAPAMV